MSTAFIVVKPQKKDETYDREYEEVINCCTRER